MTAGYGGHATAVLDRTLQKPHNFTLVDRDQNAVNHLMQTFVGADIIHTDFYSASRQLAERGEQYDLILADLGVSSPHLDDAHRGFSLRVEGPLDMRMDDRQSLTAEEIVNNYDEAELKRILRTYGESHVQQKLHA